MNVKYWHFRESNIRHSNSRLMIILTELSRENKRHTVRYVGTHGCVYEDFILIVHMGTHFGSRWYPKCVFNFLRFFERTLCKSNYIIFTSSWWGTHTKIRSKLVDIVTTGSQKITLWGPQRTPLGILRVNKCRDTNMTLVVMKCVLWSLLPRKMPWSS